MVKNWGHKRAKMRVYGKRALDIVKVLPTVTILYRISEKKSIAIWRKILWMTIL